MSGLISSSTGSIMTQNRYQTNEVTRALKNSFSDLRHRLRTGSGWFRAWESYFFTIFYCVINKDSCLIDDEYIRN